jgi:hypothetical protein
MPGVALPPTSFAVSPPSPSATASAGVVGVLQSMLSMCWDILVEDTPFSAGQVSVWQDQKQVRGRYIVTWQVQDRCKKMRFTSLHCHIAVQNIEAHPSILFGDSLLLNFTPLNSSISFAYFDD